MKQQLKLTVNGELRELLVEPGIRLVEVLRDELGLTGTKEACNTASCGACTVIMDGKAVKSCSVLALQANNKNVLTIEGLENGDNLDPIQESFIENHGLQCGFCTPGMIMTAKAFLDENPNPTKLEVREAIAGNLCRCGAYAKIIKSILAAKKTGGN